MKPHKIPYVGPQVGIASVHGAQAVGRAFAVLRSVTARGNGGASLAHVVQQTQLSKPTAHRLLTALVAEGMVEQDDRNGNYYVGAECCVLGAVAAKRFIYKGIAVTSVAKLAQATGDSAFFCLKSGTFSVCIIQEEGDYWLQSRVQAPSTRRPLGVGAAGLSMLASLDDADVAGCLEANSSILTAKYPRYSIPLLWKLVRQTRERGYAVNEGLIRTGAWGLGVAVRAPDGEVLGAFSIGAVESHLDRVRQREIAPLLQVEARRLGGQLMKR